MAFKVEGEARVAFVNEPGVVPVNPPDNGELKVQQADGLLVTRKADGSPRYTDIRTMADQLASGPLAEAVDGRVPRGAVGDEIVASGSPNIADRGVRNRLDDRRDIRDFPGVFVDGVSDSTEGFRRASAWINTTGGVVHLPALTFVIDCDVLRIGTGSLTQGSARHGGGMIGTSAPLNFPGQGTTIRARSPGQALATISGITSGVTWKGILLDCDGKANIALDTYSVCGSEIEVIARQFLYYGLAMRCRAPAGSAGWSSSNTIRLTSIVSSVVLPYGAGVLLDGEQGPEAKNYDPHNNVFMCGTIQVADRIDGPVYGIHSLFNDSNTFIEVDVSVYGGGHALSAEVFSDGSTRPFFPQNNFFIGCSVKRYRSNAASGSSFAIFHPTKDHEEVPTDPHIRGFTDDGVFFGEWRLPASRGDIASLKDIPALVLSTINKKFKAKWVKNAADNVDFGTNFVQITDGVERVDLYVAATGEFSYKPIQAATDVEAQNKGVPVGFSYLRPDGTTKVRGA